ncbi:MAG: hypothetical protein U0L17_03830 [Acutalibacteraceae bacterium]|nr:hypothetical protein [Acutalibacteraceae bacterium]
MSEKFSVEDILNEVKNMKGDKYVLGQDYSTKEHSAKEKNYESETIPFDINKSEKKKNNDAFKAGYGKESFLPEDIDKNDETSEDMPDISKMSAKELFGQIAVKAENDNDSGIIGGFTVKSDLISDDKKSASAVSEKPVKKAETFAENFDKTMVLDSEEVKFSAEKKQREESAENTVQTDTQKAAQTSESADSKSEDAPKDGDVLGNIPKKRIHTPEHLLSAEEIKSGFENEKFSFRFNERVKDLTKSRKKESAKDKFADFMNPAEQKEEKEQPSAQKFSEDIPKEFPEEIPEENSEQNLNSKVETDALAEELFNFLSEKYTENEKEKEQPDILNNEIEIKEEEKSDTVEEIPDEPLTFEKQNPENDISSTGNNRFARKTSRRIFERSFDYSEDESQEQEVIDDYTSIEDEEAVRYDLDISLKKVSKRLLLTVIIFIFGFAVTVLPSAGFDFLKFISPNDNLTGFMIANAVVLVATLLVNISSFVRGIGSLVTLKPDADSPFSIAGIFVTAQCVLAFIPEFSATAGALPFYTAALTFAYILSLMGKKSMVMRIRSNFRLVATTSVKKSAFTADERMCEMLENDDFIGTPCVATAKSVLNLHNFLRNSYSEDPSDNVSKIFAPISLIASAVTLIFTYFISKDIVSSLYYATAVAVVSAPVSVILAVNSPLKKVAMQFRQKDGLIAGYESVNEFCDVDCVAIDAEELFPAGSVELTNLRALGDISIEDVILKSAALTIGAGGPLADVFDKIIDGRRKMLPEISDIVYEDGLGLTGKVDGKIVRVGNRRFIDSYGIYGLSDSDIEDKAKQNGVFIIYTAVEDEVCGMFALKYKSIDPDIEDAVYNLVSNGISIAIKSNDPNITPELIEKVFEVPKEYVLIMQAHSAEHYDEVTAPCKNGDSLLAYGGRVAVFSNLIIACKKLKTKISAAVLIQTVLTILGFGVCMFTAVSSKGFENISALNIIIYQFLVAVISVFVPSLIKRIK